MLGIAANELITVERGGNQIVPGSFLWCFFHPDYLARAAEIDFYAAHVRQSDHVFDGAAQLDLRRGTEKNATGADIPRESAVGNVAVVRAHNADRQLKFKALISALIHHLSNLDAFNLWVNSSKIDLVMVLGEMNFGIRQGNWGCDPIFLMFGPVGGGHGCHAAPLSCRVNTRLEETRGKPLWNEGLFWQVECHRACCSARPVKRNKAN